LHKINDRLFGRTVVPRGQRIGLRKRLRGKDESCDGR